MFAKNNTITNNILLFRGLNISVFLMSLLDFVCLCMGRKNKVITKIGIQSRCSLVTQTPDFATVIDFEDFLFIVTWSLIQRIFFP